MQKAVDEAAALQSSVEGKKGPSLEPLPSIATPDDIEVGKPEAGVVPVPSGDRTAVVRSKSDMGSFGKSRIAITAVQAPVSYYSYFRDPECLPREAHL